MSHPTEQTQKPHSRDVLKITDKRERKEAHKKSKGILFSELQNARHKVRLRHGFNAKTDVWKPPFSMQYALQDKEYVAARKDYLDYVMHTDGFDAALREEKIENQRVVWGRSLRWLAGKAAIPAAGTLVIATTVTGGIFGVMLVGAGVVGGVVTNLAITQGLGYGRKTNAEFEREESAARNRGDSYESFKGGKATLIADRSKKRFRTRLISFLASVGVTFGTVELAGDSIAMAASKGAAKIIEGNASVSIPLVGNLDGHDLAHGTGHFEAALNSIRAFVKSAVVAIAEAIRDIPLPAVVTAAAAAEPAQSTRAGSSIPVEGKPKVSGVPVETKSSSVPREVTELGLDPVGRTPEEALQHANAVAEGAVRDGRWSRATADAFLRTLEANKADFIQAVKTGKSVGIFKIETLTEGDRTFKWWSDGPGGGKFGTEGNVNLPVGTKVISFDFQVTENGVTRTQNSDAALDCLNFGERVETPVEAAPVAPEAPKTLKFGTWFQEMCVDFRDRWSTYLGITINDIGGHPDWESAAREAGEKVVAGMPGYKEDFIIVRVDLDNDGIPETTKRLYIKDVGGIKAGTITDHTMRYKSGLVNISELPPEKQDLHLEGNVSDRSNVADPSAKRGQPTSVPNPVSEMHFNEDGKLVPNLPFDAEGNMILTPEQKQWLIANHVRVFLQGVMQSDLTPEQFEKIWMGLYDFSASDIVRVSPEELAKATGLTVEQAQEMQSKLSNLAVRTGVVPNKGESLQDYLVRAFIEKIKLRR